MSLNKTLANEEMAQKILYFSLGMSFGMGVSLSVFRPKIKKILTMNKLATELLNWGIKNGIRMPTVEQDYELYEKLSFLGLAARGMS